MVSIFTIGPPSASLHHTRVRAPRSKPCLQSNPIQSNLCRNSPVASRLKNVATFQVDTKEDGGFAIQSDPRAVNSSSTMLLLFNKNIAKGDRQDAGFAIQSNTEGPTSVLEGPTKKVTSQCSSSSNNDPICSMNMSSGQRLSGSTCWRVHQDRNTQRRHQAVVRTECGMGSWRQRLHSLRVSTVRGTRHCPVWGFDSQRKGYIEFRGTSILE